MNDAEVAGPGVIKRTGRYRVCDNVKFILQFVKFSVMLRAVVHNNKAMDAGM